MGALSFEEVQESLQAPDVQLLLELRLGFSDEDAARAIQLLLKVNSPVF